MSRNQKLGLVVVAVAVAIVAFVVLQPGDDDKKSDTAATTQTKTATEPGGGEKTTPEKKKPDPDAGVTKIEVKGTEPVGGVKKIEAKPGEQVRIEVSTDSDQEIHLHGYDIAKDAAPGKSAKYDFKAKLEGVFEMELEGPHVPIASISVTP